MSHIPPYLLYIATPIIAAFACGFLIPKIIFLAKRKRLFDLPDNHRKIHKEVVPNLGGVGIFFSFIIVASVVVGFLKFDNWNYLVAASTILFVVGVKDDIVSLNATKKFSAQFLSAVIIVYLADIRLHSLHGILGIYLMPDWLSISFSIVGCIFVTNAFNLIDGIDGLAGTIGTLCCLALGTCLFVQGNYGAACISFALMGALIGFLRYNIAPAKIFMGDSGALFIGFTISVLSIIFINSFDVQNTAITSFIHTPKAALLFALSVLFIPVFDSFRVFVTRLAKGQHPFRADRTHLHHYLLDLGFRHSSTVTTLITTNLLIISVSLLVQDLNPNIAISIILTLTFGLFAILYTMRKNKMAKTEITTSSKTSAEKGTHIYLNGKKPVKKVAAGKKVGIPVITTEGS